MDQVASYRALQKGEMLNWYRIENILGRGGFGVIYLATDTNLDLQVAIKEYIPTDIARRDNDSTVRPITEEHGDMYRWGLDRFIKEARNLVRFKHPNIVRVMSVFQENNTAYMVMEFEEGEDLRRHLKRVGTTTEAALKKLVGPLSEGLSEVHRHGFIHRDIKPANILVRKDGSPVLLDFGSARNASKSGPDGLTALVTVGYAPLEQYASENDEQQGPWTDIYALGGVLYYAISGNDPVDCTKRGTALFNGGRDPLSPAAIIGKEHYSQAFLNAVDWSLKLRIADRPQALIDWVPALVGDVIIEPVESLDPEYSRGDLTDTVLFNDRHRPTESDDRPTLSGVSRARYKQGFTSSGTDDMRRSAPMPAPTTLLDAQQRTVVKPRPTRKRSRKKMSKGWILVAAVMPLAAGLTVLYQRQVSESEIDTASSASSSDVAAAVAGTIDVEPTADAAESAEAMVARLEQTRRDTEEAFRARRAAERAAATERALTAQRANAERAAVPDLDANITITTGGLVLPYETDTADESTRQEGSSSDKPGASATNTTPASGTNVAERTVASSSGAVADADIEAETPAEIVAGGNADLSVAGSDTDVNTSAVQTTTKGSASSTTTDSSNEASKQSSNTQPIDSSTEGTVVARAETGSVISDELNVDQASRAIQQAEAKRLAEVARSAAAARTARAKREADRRSSFNAALGKAGAALDEARYDEAGRQIEIASATGLSNDSLTRLVKRLNSSVMDARRPVSDDDFDGVMARFDDLRRAIEKKDTPAMATLVSGDSQSQLFDQLLERFERLDIEISDIRVRNADKSISATLGIRQMVRSNGDVATPSESYRERIITSQRVNGEWSTIRW